MMMTEEGGRGGCPHFIEVTALLNSGQIGTLESLKEWWWWCVRLFRFFRLCCWVWLGQIGTLETPALHDYQDGTFLKGCWLRCNDNEEVNRWVSVFRMMVNAENWTIQRFEDVQQYSTRCSMFNYTTWGCSDGMFIPGSSRQLVQTQDS